MFWNWFTSGFLCWQLVPFYWGIFRHNPISRHSAINALILPVAVLGIFWNTLLNKFLHFLSYLMVEVHEFGNQVPQHGFDANFDWTCQFHAYFLDAFQMHLIEREMKMIECIPIWYMDTMTDQRKLNYIWWCCSWVLICWVWSGASQPTSLYMGCMASLKWDHHSVHACIACTLWLISFQRKLRH